MLGCPVDGAPSVGDGFAAMPTGGTDAWLEDDAGPCVATPLGRGAGVTTGAGVEELGTGHTPAAGGGAE